MADDLLPTFREWLNDVMKEQNVSKQALADRSGVSYPGIWNILNGNTRSPRMETRQKLANALNADIPGEVERELEEEQNEIPGYEWFDFASEDLEAVPQAGGVYVFYDVTDRPVYVGQSGNNVRARVRDHQTRFWFKRPVVVRGAYLAINDPEMCKKVEMILIKFLGKHALLNEKGAIRDVEG